MQPEERDLAYLWDMLDAAREIACMVSDKKGIDFERDKTLRYAVERLLEIMGEAAKRVSKTFQSTHGEIPWKGIAGQRDVLAHDYGDIILEKIWVIATRRIPELIKMLEPLLPDQPKE